jgi:hypothetical protein
VAGQDLPPPQIMITVRQMAASDGSEGETLAKFPAKDLLDIGDRFTLPGGSTVVVVRTRELISDAGIDQLVHIRAE